MVVQVSKSLDYLLRCFGFCCLGGFFPANTPNAIIYSGQLFFFYCPVFLFNGSMRNLWRNTLLHCTIANEERQATA